MTNARHRPIAVAVIGGWNIVVGALVMVLALGAPNAAEGVTWFAFAVVGAVIGIGLLRLRPWARMSAIAGYAVNIAVTLYHGNPLGALVAAGILTYLAASEQVKVAFRAPAPATLCSPAPAPQMATEPQEAER